jgi:hypothetical protein
VRVSPVQHGLTLKLSSVQDNKKSALTVLGAHRRPVSSERRLGHTRKSADSDARDVDFAVGRSLLRQTINLNQTYSGAAILAAHNRSVVTGWKRDKNC